MQFVLYDSFVQLCWNQADDLRISEFERSRVQLIALCERALRIFYPDYPEKVLSRSCYKLFTSDHRNIFYGIWAT